MASVPDRRAWRGRVREFIALMELETSEREEIVAIKLELVFREGISFGLSEAREALRS